MANEKRLIDANAIKYRKKDEYCGNGNSRPVRYVFDDDIAELPTVDAVEVVHGRWIYEPVEFSLVKDIHCSVCRRYVKVPENYCPDCGAKMDGGNDDV